MAKIETTVSSPTGDITSFDGRVSAPVARVAAKSQVEREIERLQAHLDEVNSWEVRTHRGTLPVRSYEEIHAL